MCLYSFRIICYHRHCVSEFHGLGLILRRAFSNSSLTLTRSIEPRVIICCYGRYRFCIYTLLVLVVSDRLGINTFPRYLLLSLKLHNTFWRALVDAWHLPIPTEYVSTRERGFIGHTVLHDFVESALKLYSAVAASVRAE